MQTISAEQFKQKYGNSSVNTFNQPQKQEGYIKNLTEAVGGDLEKRIERFRVIEADPNRNILEKGVQMFGQGAGLAADVLEQTVLQAPGVKQIVGKIGQGMNWLTTSELSPIKHLGDVIGSNKTLQATTRLYDTNPRFRDTVDALANTVRLGGDVSAILNSGNFTANVTNKVIKEIKNTTADIISGVEDTTTDIASSIKTKAIGATEKTPTNIMNRVARLNPNDEIKFTKMSGGKTPGQYLVDTGNFNEPRKLILNEANKFVASKASVDAELAKLPGVYKVGALDDILTGLKEKAISTSGAKVKAPYARIVDDLITKNTDSGLTMEEINTAKGLYERYVKTGYNKLTNADKVEQATNIDSALRNWQVGKARELGFTNISELNKQTQLSKFIIDKLGDKIVGQSGLNGFNLTDWIILSGGSPQAISGFLVKKFFSSKGVQARIAEIMNQKEIQGLKTPQTSITAENIRRRVSPQGLEGLPAPTNEFRSVSPSGKTLPVAPQGRQFEFTGKQGGIIPSVKKAPLSVKISNVSDDLIKEALKHETAEEFVKAFKKRSFNPFGMDDTKIPKADIELHGAFIKHTQRPEIQKIYEGGGNDIKVLTDIWNKAREGKLLAQEGFFKGGIKGKIDQSKTYVITDIRNKFVGHFIGDKNSVANFVKEKLGIGYQYKKMNE